VTPFADLAGRLAVVTGAAGNLGRLWSSVLSEAGMKVVGIDVRPDAGIEQADVTDRPSLERVLEAQGAPHLLVNNAGIDTPPGADAGASFSETLGVNLLGVYNATEVFGSAMRDAGRGSIVNIGSLYATVAPDPSFYDHFQPIFQKPAAYGASKAGVSALTRYYARLWGPHGVRVNALSPGGVLAGQDEEFRRKYCARVPLGRMAEPADLVGPMLFLASDASRYVTGHELRVDGGFTA
jgi:NAD(P)-dependent dehydrogenase (short-subunit alcohol dehydrogenase family)